MEAKDLMIGDLVSVNNKPVLVVNVHENCINFIHDIPFVQEEYYIEQRDVQPIPLTPEILEKNGAWCEHNIGYVMEEGEYEIIYDLLDHKLRILKNREQILNLEYWDEMCVHELQHALRLCEINKEITIS